MRFPRLFYMAVDFLTIASSSAETERDFSSCGRMITPLRSRLRRYIVAMAQCLRSWSKAGIYQPSLPLNLLEGDNWRHVLQLLGRISVEDSKGRIDRFDRRSIDSKLWSIDID